MFSVCFAGFLGRTGRPDGLRDIHGLRHGQRVEFWKFAGEKSDPIFIGSAQRGRGVLHVITRHF